jgi:hypothetical protein
VDQALTKNKITIQVDRCLLEDLREHQVEYQLLDEHERVKLERFNEGPSFRVLVEKVIVRYIQARSKTLDKP